MGQGPVLRGLNSIEGMETTMEISSTPGRIANRRPPVSSRAFYPLNSLMVTTNDRLSNLESKIQDFATKNQVANLAGDVDMLRDDTTTVH